MDLTLINNNRLLPVPLSALVWIPPALPSPGRPQAVLSRHPLLPAKDREEVYERCLANETLLDFLKRTGLWNRMGRAPYCLQINGARVPREMWGRVRPKPGMLINIYAEVHGGNGKNPVALVAMIALWYFAPEIAGFITPEGSSAGAITFLKVGVMVVGGIAINALFPPPKPAIPAIPRESPSYAIEGGSNRYRRYEPFPLIIGVFRIFPDWGAQPFTDYQGTDQFGYYTYELGYNDLDLSDFKIGSTLTATFPDLTINESNIYNGQLTLFPGNVDTVITQTQIPAGANSCTVGTWVTKTSSPDATQLSVDITGTLFQFNNRGELQPATVLLEFQYRKVGDVSWIPITFASDSEQQRQQLFGDRFYPFPKNRGAFPWNGPCSAEPPLGIFPAEAVPAGLTRIIYGSANPLRRTYSWAVAQGQYEIQIRRIDADGTQFGITDHSYGQAYPFGDLVDLFIQYTYPFGLSNRIASIFWEQLRTFQPDLSAATNSTYEGRKRLAVKLRATGQLAGIVDRFNVIARAKTYIWNGTDWVRAQTSNPAWWYLAIARGKFYPSSYVSLDGTAGNFISTPDSVANSFTTGLDVRIKAGATDWTPTSQQQLASKWGAAGNRAWKLYVFTDGKLKLELSQNGTASTVATSSVATGITDGSALYLRATWRASDGRVQFFTSQDNYTWTLLGTDQTIALASLFDSSAPVEIGSMNGGTEVFNGKIYCVEIRPVIDGGMVAWFEANDGVTTALTSWDGVTGETWTINGLIASITKGTRVWGAGIPLRRIDIATLKLFGAWCDSQSLSVNCVFDQQISSWDMLQAIALRGRGTPSYGTGKLGVIWDAPSQPVVAVFGMANIIPGSFEVEYATEDLADSVEGEFINPDLDWQTDLVRAAVPGATGTAKNRRIQLFGCTNLAQAKEDTNLYAANNAYRSRRYKWNTDWEGMPASRGDVIEFSHDLASLDYSGRFVEGGSTTSLKLGRQVPLYSAAAYIIIVKPDGTFATYMVNSGTGNSDTVVPASALPFDPWNDASHPPYDYKWLYGPTSTPGKKVKIDGFRPLSEREVEFSAIDEVPEYYLSKSNSLAYTPAKQVFGPLSLANLVLTPEGIRAGSGYAVRVTASWDVTGDYSYSEALVTVNHSTPFLVTGEMGARGLSFTIPDNSDVTVDLTAFTKWGRQLGSAKISTTSRIFWSLLNPPSDVETFLLSGAVFRWNVVGDVDVVGYKIKFHYGNNTSWSDANELHQGVITENAYEAPALPSSQPGSVTTFMICAIDAAGLESVNPARIVTNIQDEITSNEILFKDFELTPFVDNYVLFDGTSGCYLGTPDSAAASVVGDIDLRAKVAPTDVTPTADVTVLAKWNTTGGILASVQRSYALQITTGGFLQLLWSVDGVATITKTATAVLPFADGSTFFARATLDVDNGAAGNDVKFYYSVDYNPLTDTGTWTQLGTTVTTGGTTNIFDSTAILEVSGTDSGTLSRYTGKVFYAEVRNGLNGTIVAVMDPSYSATVGTASWTASTSEVWTVNGAASIKRQAGVVTQGKQIGTDLKSDTETSFYNQDESASMYGIIDAASFYGLDLFKFMQYETAEFVFSQVLRDSQLVLRHTILGSAITIELRDSGPNSLYGPDTDPLYGPDADPFYETPPDYSVWTGSLIIKSGVYQIRISTGQATIQGVIDHLKLIVDAPDVEEFFDDLVIAPGGTRVTLTKSWFDIDNIQITLQQSGGSTAITAKTLDKSIPLGPLIACYDASNVSVAGLVDVRVKGH